MVAGEGTGAGPIIGGVPTGAACAATLKLGAAGVFGEPTIAVDVGDAGTAGSGAVAVDVDGPGPADAWGAEPDFCCSAASAAFNFFSRATCKSSCRKFSPKLGRLGGGFGLCWAEL